MTIPPLDRRACMLSDELLAPPSNSPRAAPPAEPGPQCEPLEFEGPVCRSEARSSGIDLREMRPEVALRTLRERASRGEGTASLLGRLSSSALLRLPLAPAQGPWSVTNLRLQREVDEVLAQRGAAGLSNTECLTLAQRLLAVQPPGPAERTLGPELAERLLAMLRPARAFDGPTVAREVSGEGRPFVSVEEQLQVVRELRAAGPFATLAGLLATVQGRSREETLAQMRLANAVDEAFGRSGDADAVQLMQRANGPLRPAPPTRP